MHTFRFDYFSTRTDCFLRSRELEGILTQKTILSGEKHPKVCVKSQPASSDCVVAGGSGLGLQGIRVLSMLFCLAHASPDQISHKS